MGEEEYGRGALVLRPKRKMERVLCGGNRGGEGRGPDESIGALEAGAGFWVSPLLRGGGGGLRRKIV